MNLTNNLKNVAGNVQQGARNLSASLLQKVLRLITGFFIGIVLALIVQELTKSNTLILLFLITLFMAMVYRVLRALSIWQILVFDIICVLLANTLRMYVLMAP